MSLDALLLRHRVESFLYREADLLDRWQLEDWLTLFREDARYLVPPTDVPGDEADPDTSLFYVFDDYARIRERVVRLAKRTAHSEWPRSKTRHMVSNVLAEALDGHVEAKASFAVYRSKDGVTDVFVGHYLYALVDEGETFRIREKKCVLDMEALRPHARISILL